MDKEIIYDKTSEEYKAIKLLESKITSYSDHGSILHYNIILYNLIINLMKENKKQKEIIDKVKDYCHSEIDKCKYEQSDDEWECCIEELKGVLSILEDKEV